MTCLRWFTITIQITISLACDTLLVMPDHCYCEAHNLICDSLQGNWTGNVL